MDSLYSAERDLDRLEAKTVQAFDRNSAYRVCMDLVALSRSYRNRTEAVARHSPATPRDHHFVVRPVGSCCVGFVGSCIGSTHPCCIGSTHPCCIGSTHPCCIGSVHPCHIQSTHPYHIQSTPTHTQPLRGLPSLILPRHHFPPLARPPRGGNDAGVAPVRTLRHTVELRSSRRALLAPAGHARHSPLPVDLPHTVHAGRRDGAIPRSASSRFSLRFSSPSRLPVVT